LSNSANVLIIKIEVKGVVEFYSVYFDQNLVIRRYPAGGFVSLYSRKTL